MKDPRNSNHDDLLQQATRALRQTHVPDGPPGDALADLVAALENAANQDRTLTFVERILVMKPLTKITAAAASLLIICGTAAWMMTAGGGASVALADVADVLEKIHSATWTLTATREGKPPETLKAMYLDPSRSRMENPQGMVMIYNESKMITLGPEKKFAVIVALENAPEDGIVKNWIEDVRQEIREAIAGPGDNVEELGRRQVDGRVPRVGG